MSRDKKGKSRSSGNKEIAADAELLKLASISLNAIDDALHIVGPDMRIILINSTFRKWCRALKVPVDGIIGQKLRDAFPFLGEHVFEQYDRVWKTGKPLIIDEEETDLGGNVVISASRKIPIKKDGKVTHIITILRDITEQKRAERALRASEDHYRVVVDNVQADIALLDRDGVFIFVNESSARSLGYKPEEIVGRPQSDFFPPEATEIQLRNIRKTIDEEIEFREEVRSFVGGRWKWYDINIQPLNISGDKIDAALVIAIDITDRQEAGEALRQSEERFRRQFAWLPIPTYTWRYDGEDFTLIEYNKAAEIITSGGVKNFVGNKARQMYDKDSEITALLHKCYNEKKTFTEEMEYKYQSTNLAKRLIVYYVYVPPDMVIVHTEDITERYIANEALKQSEERFRLQYAELPIPTYTWEYQGDDFTLVDYNKAADVITDGGMKGFVGSRAGIMYADAPDIRKAMRQCYENKTTMTDEIEYYYKTTKKFKYLSVRYVYVPPSFVIVHTEDITERRAARDALQAAHDELEKRVKERTEELDEAIAALRVDREALRQKNIALREVLDQIEDGRRQMASQIQSNISRIAIPILNSLEGKVTPAGKQYINLLRESLEDIASPLIITLETKFSHLTPRELEVCNMVKSGLSSKEIADTCNTSVQTVLKQRTVIRKKLGISNSQTNLASYLKSLE